MMKANLKAAGASLCVVGYCYWECSGRTASPGCQLFVSGYEGKS